MEGRTRIALALQVLLLSASMSASLSVAPPLVRVAGSSTVEPVSKRWQTALGTNYSWVDHSGNNTVCAGNSTVCGGGSSMGASRVCAERSSKDHVDIGDMSREWKDSEAVLLDDGYTFECIHSKNRITQMVVGVDGLAVVTAASGPAASCILTMGGLTLAQLRWMFSDWTDEQLRNDRNGGVDVSSVAPHDDNNGVKEWSDLNVECAAVPINIYGAGALSGTSAFFGEAVFCANCFAKKAGYTPEKFPACSKADIDELDHLEALADIQSFLDTKRNPDCYMPSEDDEQIMQWVTMDKKGIAYFGYAYFAHNAPKLSVVRIASDTKKGVHDTTDALIMPSAFAIMDGSYAVFTRTLYMNVDNAAWPLVKKFMEFGYSDTGMELVAEEGYVKPNAAIRAKMSRRVAEGGNPTADYITLPPDECPNGTALNETPYLNVFGNPKTEYTCVDCEVGFAKADNRPIKCSPCIQGTFASTTGSSACTFCKPGEYAEQGSSKPSLCPLNTCAPMPGQGQCNTCDQGFFTDELGATSCDRCAEGTYRTMNDSICVTCPVGMTTEFRAATQLIDCACAEDSFLIEGGTVMGPCAPCPPGMVCPFGSRFDNFAKFAEDPLLPIPTLEKHHWSNPSEPLSSFKCRIDMNSCPGGGPGTCNGGRVGRVCAVCPEGQTWGDHGCMACAGGFGAVLYLAVFACSGSIIFAYYAGNSPLRANVTIATAGSTLASQFLTIVQILSMFKDLNVQWPADVRHVFEGLAFTVGSGGISYECFLGSKAAWKYSFRCILPIFFVCNIVLVYFGSKVVAKIVKFKSPGTMFKAWDLDGTLNTAGQILQALFIGVAAIVVVPLQCYPHPNGLKSLSQYPEVLCFHEGDHTMLLLFGVMIAILFVIPFLAYCIYGTYLVVNPKECETGRESAHHAERMIRRYRFLLFRFRADVWWWGNLFMLRQLLLAFAPSLPATTPHGQSIYVIIVLCFYGFAQAHYWPWKAPEFNLLDLYVTAGLVVVITISMVFIPTTEDTADYAKSLIAFLFVLGLGMIVLLSRIGFYTCKDKFLKRSRSTLPGSSFGSDKTDVDMDMGRKMHGLANSLSSRGIPEFVESLAQMSYYDRIALVKGLNAYAASMSEPDPKMVLKLRLTGLTRSDRSLDSSTGSHAKVDGSSEKPRLMDGCPEKGMADYALVWI
mmetsp:Transcript_25054/g.83597  ORF Transcript_25054/g.83597 Transcript_25054/m.83597 type:complete len:1172 (-) Transcript_25054:119-3634(-)